MRHGGLKALLSGGLRYNVGDSNIRVTLTVQVQAFTNRIVWWCSKLSMHICDFLMAAEVESTALFLISVVRHHLKISNILQ